HYAAFISPDSFTFVHSFDLFVMNLVGGAGTFLGPVVGPVFLTVVGESLRGLSPALSHVVYGVLLIVVIVVLPVGLVGGVRRLAGRVGGGVGACRPRDASSCGSGACAATSAASPRCPGARSTSTRARSWASWAPTGRGRPRRSTSS